MQKSQSSVSHLILYDGVCGLCNRLNAFVLKHDKKADFRFASLQSATGQSILRQYGLKTDDLDTFHIIANYGSDSAVRFERARAGLFVLKTLGTPWSWTGIFAVLPDWLLNPGYNLVARSRYRIFGKYDRCMLPSAEHRERFMDV